MEGDYAKVLSFMRAHHPKLNEFQLVFSPGGNVLEALKIGRLFRTYLMRVHVPLVLTTGEWTTPGLESCEGKRCMCTSACALIFRLCPR